MTTPGPGRPTGSLADEAGQLIDAVAARLAVMKVGVAAAGPGPAETDAVHTCLGWCPVCRGAELLRGDRPELSDKLIDTALVVLDALRTLLPDQPPATADDAQTTDPADRAGIERIDIR